MSKVTRFAKVIYRQSEDNGDPFPGRDCPAEIVAEHEGDPHDRVDLRYFGITDVDPDLTFRGKVPFNALPKAGFWRPGGEP